MPSTGPQMLGQSRGTFPSVESQRSPVLSHEHRLIGARS